MISKYDIVIAGGGMAGLSLAYYLTQNVKISNLQILIIDPSQKVSNDRTWGFWQKQKSAFDHLLTASWTKVVFKSSQGEVLPLDLENYQYKLLRGIDFYDFVKRTLKQFPNVTFLREKVINIDDQTDKVLVTTESKKLEADWVFDSTFKLDLSNPDNQNMLQHFKGAVIETTEEVFDPELPDLMNFSVPQKNDECRFVYVLPFSKTKALVEYTLFTEELLSEEAYDEELYSYIKEHISKDFTVVEDEFGIIPMSDVQTTEFPSERVVRIGTAGGGTNPATGYTFANTQNRLQELVTQLAESGSPIKPKTWWEKRHHLYAAILLNVLLNKRYLAAVVFEELYKKNPPALVFKFLDGATSFAEELKIMWSTRIYHFGLAAIDVLKRRLL